MADIEFFSQGISFKVPKPFKTKRWIRTIIEREGKDLAHLNYVFCSDAYLYDLNQRYLHHKTLTDIITFDHSEETSAIEGDIYISVERVMANSTQLKRPFEEELQRVMIHGVLHLIGYRDKSPTDKVQMRKKEDACLSLRNTHTS